MAQAYVSDFLMEGMLCMMRPYLSLVMRNLIGLIVYRALMA